MGINKVWHIKLRQGRPSFFPCTKVGRGTPTCGIGSQKPAQVAGTGPDPTARNSTNRHNCHTRTEALGCSQAGPLAVSPESLSS